MYDLNWIKKRRRRRKKFLKLKWKPIKMKSFCCRCYCCCCCWNWSLYFGMNNNQPTHKHYYDDVENVEESLVQGTRWWWWWYTHTTHMYGWWNKRRQYWNKNRRIFLFFSMKMKFFNHRRLLRRLKNFILLTFSWCCLEILYIHSKTKLYSQNRVSHNDSHSSSTFDSILFWHIPPPLSKTSEKNVLLLTHTHEKKNIRIDHA